MTDIPMIERKCLKCQKNFFSKRPKSEHRICTNCNKGTRKDYGKKSSSSGGRRSGKSVGAGI